MLECIQWSVGKPSDTRAQMVGLITINVTEDSYIWHLKWFRVGSTGGLAQCALFTVLCWQFPDMITVTFCNPYHYLHTSTQTRLSLSPQNTLTYPFISLMPIQLTGDDNNLSVIWPFPHTVHQACNVFLRVYWCVLIRLSSTSPRSHLTWYHALKSQGINWLHQTCLLTPIHLLCKVILSKMTDSCGKSTRHVQ